MFAGCLFTLITAIFIYRMGYDAGRRSAYVGVIDAIQYPPGCRCIRNALMPNSRCPHHGERKDQLSDSSSL